MARRRRTRTLTKLRQGFKIPTHSKIRTSLRNKSKGFIISLFLTAFGMLPKGKKIKLLIKIERGLGRIKRRSKTKRRTRKRTTRRKTRRRSRTRRRRTGRRGRTRRKSKGRRKGRTAKQRAATRKLVAFNKRRRA